MKLSSWAVASWPTVEWYIPKHKAKWPKFNQGAVSAHREEPSSLHRGTALWVGVIGNQAVGLAWDWVEVKDGVLAIADPNGICSNLRLLKDEDHFESEAATCLSLYRLVHRLQWQAPAVATVRANQAENDQSFCSPGGGAGIQSVEGGTRPLAHRRPASYSTAAQRLVGAGD
jgi:hypothetical protein